MSSVQYLREFVTERLTAAAEEIFRVFEQTIVEYEEEIDRQRRLLDIVWKPEIRLHRIELPHQHVFKEEEVLTDQQVCNQERNSSLDQEDPDPPQIKEEQEKLCFSQEGEQLVLKQETDNVMLIPTYEESDHSEPEPMSDHQLLSHSSPVAESQHWKGSKQTVNKLTNKQKKEADSGSTRNAEPKPKKRHRKNRSHSDTKTELPHRHVCKKEVKVLTDQQLCNQERNSSLDQENSNPPQNKEEQDELCSSQDGEQFVLKQETDNVMLIPTYDSDHQLLSHSSPVAHNVDISPVSETHCNTHPDEKTFKCDTCGKAFKCRSKLHEHLRVHTGEKPYVCNTCGKRFSRRSNFKTHFRIHTGEKPYSCKTCGGAFRISTDLKVHMTRVHTGEKPDPTTTSGKSFTANTAMVKHKKMYKRKRLFTCDTCGKIFRQAGALIIHLRIHTGEKPYLCNTCGKRFSQMPHLKTHMGIHTT